MNKLRVGVIGLGFIGELHARIVYELPNAVLVAVSDVREDVTNKIAAQFGCCGYIDYKEMVLAGGLDAVSITLPDELHEEAAVFAFEHGLAVLLEKPAAKTTDSVKRIYEGADNAGSRLMIAHVLHFDPRYAQLRESIKRGELGEIVHMYFRRTNPRANAKRLNGRASIFYYIGVHDFEMMCSYSQSRPIKVYCRKVQKVNAYIPSEDTIFATIDFADGSIGVVELCWALPNNSALGINTYAEILGTEGVGYINIQDQGISIITEESVLYPDTLHWPEYNGMLLGDLKEELAHFVTATLSGVPYIVDNRNALMAATIIDACFESIRTGFPVDITNI